MNELGEDIGKNFWFNLSSILSNGMWLSFSDCLEYNFGNDLWRSIVICNNLGNNIEKDEDE